MNKIEIKDLYLVFGPEKQKAFRMLKERKSKNEILKATNCTVAVKNANLTIKEGEFFVIMGPQCIDDTKRVSGRLCGTGYTSQRNPTDKKRVGTYSQSENKRNSNS